MPPEAQVTSPPLTLKDLVDECRKEYDATRQKLKEIGLLIQQSSNEVDKLARRNAQVTNRLRQMEATMDTVPRRDIIEIYTALQETQKRLFMMRGQLEKLQSDRQHLEQYANLLRRFLDVAENLEAAERGASPIAAASPDTSGDRATIINIIEAQERERQHLARQMHDGPAQSLTNLVLQAEICEKLFETDPVQARVELANLKTAVKNTFEKTREFIFDLRPMMLDDLGLVPTMKRYIDDFRRKSGIDTTLTISGEERRLAPHSEVTIFRAVQELLANARDHGHPTHIKVLLDLEGDPIVAVVEDDGSGFDVDEVLGPARRQKTLGISTMKERVERLGGRLEVESSLGRGTKVTLEIPAT